MSKYYNKFKLKVINDMLNEHMDIQMIANEYLYLMKIKEDV